MPENKRYRVISSKRGSLSHARGFPLSGLLGIHSYSGNRRSTFSYDVNGNVTSDATNSLQSSYNLINLPSQIKSGSTVKANYTYLSDGTKAAAYTSASAGKDYVGSFTYTRGSGGSKTLESVAFGTRHPNGLTQLSANRWRFSGKEEQDGFGIAYSDFGARLYDRTAAWTAIDPMAEKYYSVSPYAYCSNNPVNRIDLNGMTDWIIVRQGAYSFVGWVASTIGGAVMAGASSGALAGLSAFLISDGIVAIGAGVSLMTVGFVDDAPLTENAQDIPMSIPEMGGVVYDALSGDSDHTGEKMGSIIDFGIGVIAIGVGGPKPFVPTEIGFSAQTKSLYDSLMEEKRNGAEANDVYIQDAQDIKSLYLWNPSPELKYLLPEE